MNAAKATASAGADKRSAPRGPKRFGGESVRYLFVSVAALGWDLATYAVLIANALTPVAAGALGYLVGLVIHYALSTRWVFPDADGQRQAASTFAKFVATGLFGLAVTAGIIEALTRSGAAGPFTARGVAVVGTSIAVFALRRTYVFAAAPRL